MVRFLKVLGSRPFFVLCHAHGSVTARNKTFVSLAAVMSPRLDTTSHGETGGTCAVSRFSDVCCMVSCSYCVTNSPVVFLTLCSRHLLDSLYHLSIHFFRARFNSINRSRKESH
jgi:hypothetical protein